ncbi:MAG TPA: hypothetical protein VNV66_09690 [Pilimelia sp.]|nr:hypothetical protein [Pilimelia sp.]
MSTVRPRQDGGVRRTFTYVLVWVVATSVTAMGSWLGVRSVLDAGGPQRSRPLSAAEVRRRPAPTAPPARSPSR